MSYEPSAQQIGKMGTSIHILVRLWLGGRILKWVTLCIHLSGLHDAHIASATLFLTYVVKVQSQLGATRKRETL